MSFLVFEKKAGGGGGGGGVKHSRLVSNTNFFSSPKIKDLNQITGRIENLVKHPSSSVFRK